LPGCKNRIQILKAKFHSLEYLRINARRLEHLASLHLPIAGKTVLELGAGIGDHSHYFLDRKCRVTITEARRSNLSYLRRRYPHADIRMLNLENPRLPYGARFDVVHCYGILYHLTDPQAALAFIHKVCGKLLLLETCVSFGKEESIHPVKELGINHTQSHAGSGCRPTRPWLYRALKKHFDYVYIPRAQPNHEQFPLDWSVPQSHGGPNRAIFIGSRIPLNNERLSEELLTQQTRHE